ncbi:hypothetical protein [Mucilaginibacter xinganensis]|uniref:Uncharacterized protein n=1 Tax=Mucilaginibacter xinganensis TaxID=1234841 RepID=A0A223NUK7_9SPHI|nr:hypothetical protein [Mucilaginibacter xinganensis]ASU33201.1 hypothetical protein MuYL_1303 [Mucilaginibacter xinganensis]
MIKNILQHGLALLLILASYAAFAQSGTMPGATDKTKPDNKTNDGTSSFKFGVNYSSNNVFMGRSDTVRTPAIIPQIKYTLKSGIYFSGSLDLIPGKKKKKLDGGDLSAGYDMDITDDLSAGASYSKLFYNSNSTQIASSVTSTFNVNLNYDLGDIISALLNADYNLNKKGINNDVFLNAGITHDFSITGVFGDDDIFLISPTVAGNAGSQNFYDGYLIKKNFKSAKRTAAQNALVAQYSATLGRFSLLDYELSAPLEYKTGHFIFQFTPTYAIVENQLPKQIAAALSTHTSVFYFETGVFLKF